MKKKSIKSLGKKFLACLMVFVSVLSVPVSANAHVVRKASWTMQLPAAAAELSSDLLTEEGQNIRVNTVSHSRQIEIPIKNEQNVSWNMTATCLSPGHVRATLSSPDADWDKESPSIYYYYEEEEEVKTEAEAVAEGEDVLTEEKDEGTQIVYLNLTVLGSDPASGNATQTPEDTNQPAEGTDQTTEGTESSAGATETVPEESGTSTLSLFQNSEGSTSEEGSSATEGGSNTENDTTTEGGSTSEGDGTTDESTSSGTTDNSTPSTVYVRVTLTYGMEMTDYGEFEEGEGKTISATFYIPIKESEQEAMTGTLKSCPSQYNPEAAIPLMTGEKSCELKLNQAENKEFPAMTRYTIGDGRSWVLYDGGTIRIPAKTAFSVDLSLTELNDNASKQGSEPEDGSLGLLEAVDSSETEKTKLEIKAGRNTHNLEYVEVPTTKATGMPFVLTKESVVLNVPYQWGNAVPSAVIEQLKLQDGKLEWVAADDFFTVAPSTTGNEIMISKVGLPVAGTYRIKLSWIENRMALYNLDTVFYLQRGNLG